MTTTLTDKTILLIGGGENDFAREGESDSALVKAITTFQQLGLRVVIIDENPFSVSLEMPNVTPIFAPMTVVGLQAIIREYAVDFLLPFLGGERAWRLIAQMVLDWETLGDEPFPVQVLGFPVAQTRLLANPTGIIDYLDQFDLPVITSEVVADLDEATDLMREVGLPLMVKALNPSQENTRRLITRLDDFEPAITAVQGQSLTNEIVISQAIGGFKEISVAVVRDAQGTLIQVGASEDMDPIGIHTNDSLSVTPIVTLSDHNIQLLRQHAFDVANALKIVGALHVQFAIDEDSHEIYVTKVTPYIDGFLSLIERATGYPLVQVASQLALGIALPDVTLRSEFAPQAALIAPMMDHLVVKLPIFPFGDLEADGVQVNRQLTTIQKSVGATFGFGRTFIEALEKAIRAAHFNNRSFSPTVMQAMSDDELIQQLIHPQDNRVLLLIEAIRRGYEVDELAELTDIDEFYFHQLRRLDQLESDVVAKPFDSDVLRHAKASGLSDGLIARFWQTSFEFIRQSAADKQINVTYKAVEPSAGEFPDRVRRYYSTFESENESTQTATNTILVVGSGAFRLGDGASAGYVTTMVLSALRRRGFTTVLMNNNAHDATLVSALSDKQYLEPLEISDVMNVVALEKPLAIFVPGNRQKLIDALREQGQTVFVLPKTKHTPLGPAIDETITWQIASFDGEAVTALTAVAQTQRSLQVVPTAPLPALETTELLPGLYQIDAQDNIVPLSYTLIAFLSQIYRVNLVDWLVGMQIGEQLPAPKLTTYQPYQLQISDTNFALHLQPEGELNAFKFAMGTVIKKVET
ncbi:MAG TPA: ATP-grasp domain-containing protein [Lactobacillaceae bacterium]|jgi:carbamoyl-phosphate synthase large subunit